MGEPELRALQVIVNTHSPVVFQQVPDDSVVFVKPIEAAHDTGRRFKRAQFLCLSDTWRAQDREHAARGDLLPYLNPVLAEEHPERPVKKRVIAIATTCGNFCCSLSSCDLCKD